MRKILVADDDPISRIFLSKTLENNGFMVIQSSDGDRAYQVLCDNPDIAMLITDMMMPTLDGRGLLSRCEADGSLASRPVLLLSGVLDAAEVDDLTASGRARFLNKPVRSEALLFEVEALLEAR